MTLVSEMQAPNKPSEPNQTDSNRAFDWGALLALGLYNLKLSPQEFWQLTPFELRIKMGIVGDARQKLGRAQFEALCARFPDETHENKTKT